MNDRLEISHVLELRHTADATGYVRCRPEPEPDFDTLCQWVRLRPEDAFLRRYFIDRLIALSPEERRAVSDAPLVAEGLFEAAIATGQNLEGENRPETNHSPLIYEKWKRTRKKTDALWMARFEENLTSHVLPSKTDLRNLEEPDLAGPDLPEAPVPISMISPVALPSPPTPGVRDVTLAAIQKLVPLRPFLDREMRHESSLSPVALLQKWQVDHTTTLSGCEGGLSGPQTSYGKGLDLDTARVSCVMEVAERISSFAGFTKTVVANRLAPTPIKRARLSELASEGVCALDPNDLLLEAPYEDESIWWMPGELAGKDALPILVPVQSVFLFANLPEAQLFSGLGSTGLASGSSMEGARLSGLMEAIERDADTTMPVDPEQFFTLTAEDCEVAALLADYQEKGVSLWFQDITTEFGIPCYRCFVHGKNGVIAKGTGAGLSGRKALLSALTETPYPYPHSPESHPAPEGLSKRNLESLPDFDTKNPATNLNLVETCLMKNGYRPVHVPITRRDLRIPVVRSLIPGLELLGDFDRFSTVNQRLFRRFQQLVNKNAK